MDDEIIPAEFNSVEPPAVTDVTEDPSAGMKAWGELSDSEKLDVLHMKVDSIGQLVDFIGRQVAWIGQTFQGVINTVGKISPVDIFKMMRGGK